MAKIPEILIVGSMALDDIETPFGKGMNLLGGSATYAAYAASFFAKTAISSIIGEDFPHHHKNLLKNRKIDMKGVHVVGKTFRWQGYYEYDMNAAKTLNTALNCLELFHPILPEKYKDIEYVFLGNVDPHQQLQVIEQLNNPKLIVADTMNLWIEHTREILIELIKKIDILVFNDGEARELFKTVNLMQAAKKALSLGPKCIIIKKGEHGALMFTKKDHFNAPGYPLEVVKDPTGCGDCFGGGFVGYIASQKSISVETIKKAIVYGSVCASYNAEDFSLNRLKGITKRGIEKRFREFKKMSHF